jgi:hypothetical protein
MTESVYATAEGSTVPQKAPDAMDHNERMRCRRAAFLVTREYPGPAGVILSREILQWEEFGYRFGNDSEVKKLIDQVTDSAK